MKKEKGHHNKGKMGHNKMEENKMGHNKMGHNKNKKGGKKVTEFFRLKEEARLADKPSFEYTNKDGVKNTYVRTKTKTGMTIYKQK
tara:strand:+ start:535 stop:792 length:258 start_codon:yes stop_codon:yes gene_type:complete